MNIQQLYTILGDLKQRLLLLNSVDVALFIKWWDYPTYTSIISKDVGVGDREQLFKSRFKSIVDDLEEEPIKEITYYIEYLETHGL